MTYLRSRSNLILIMSVSVILAIFQGAQLALTLNSVLDINQTFPYLIEPKSGKLIEPRDYMDFENIYTPNETYRLQQSSQGRNYHLLKAFDFANYFQSDYWHYSSKEELRLSAFPVANEDRCAKQLNWLEAQLNRSENLFASGQEHINLMTLVDSFGRPEANSYLGHNLWLGSYYECVRVAINTSLYEYEERCRASNSCAASELPRLEQQHSNKSPENILKGRYCLGKAHDPSWPTQKEDSYSPRIAYKIGLCLPETCETLSYERHAKQIERLMRYNMPEYLRNRMSLHDLYCLPDARSPIRKLSLPSRVFIGLNAVWLASLLLATIVFSLFKSHQRDLKNILMDTSGAPVGYADACEHSETSAKLMLPAACETKGCLLSSGAVRMVGLTGGGSNGSPAAMVSCSQRSHQSPLACSPDQLSTNSYKSSSASLAVWLRDSPLAIKIIKCLSVEENMHEFSQPPLLLRQPQSARSLRINLNALDFIKCLCCVMVIFGHIVFIHMQHSRAIYQSIELSYEITPRILIAFFNFVDTFFIISGMLTAYFVFKRFNAKTFSSPLTWFNVSLLRLIRLSPIYVLVFWFAKTLSVHLFEGPIWDYGTDKNSIRGLCINDHWWKSLLYLGNTGTMQPLCILPAWSIIVDAQYSLVIPPVLCLLLKHKRLGYLLLLLATVVSTAKMSFQLATQTAVKTSDMAKVRFHVYPLISRFAAEFYNTAWNRIGPVAIGIVGGHMLYLYDIGKIRRWPWFMRDAAFKLVLVMHLFIFIMPTLGKYADDPRARSAGSSGQPQPNGNEAELTVFLLSNATIKPVWSIINTILLLRLITDLRKHSVIAKLGSHNIWHCLGKLCFISYLIHYEVILVVLKSREEGHLVANWTNAGREFSLVFLISTFLSYVIYILYEAPINKLITLFMSKPEYASERKQLNNQQQATSTASSPSANNDSIAFHMTSAQVSKLNSNRHNSQNVEHFEISINDSPPAEQLGNARSHS